MFSIGEITTNYLCILLLLPYWSEKLLQIISAFYYDYYINQRNYYKLFAHFIIITILIIAFCNPLQNLANLPSCRPRKHLVPSWHWPRTEPYINLMPRRRIQLRPTRKKPKLPSKTRSPTSPPQRRRASPLEISKRWKIQDSRQETLQQVGRRHQRVSSFTAACRPLALFHSCMVLKCIAFAITFKQWVINPATFTTPLIMSLPRFRILTFLFN